MASPCPRCGNTKTESVRHGFIHDKLWDFGYHLRRCSFCDRWRLFKRANPEHPHPDEMSVEELQEEFNRKIAESLRKDPEGSEAREENMEAHTSEVSPEFEAQAGSTVVGVAEAPEEIEEYRFCPKCMSTLFRRSRRRWYERWLLRRHRMARCLKCDCRFPYPH